MTEERPPDAFTKEQAAAGAQLARSLVLANLGHHRSSNPIWRAELEELIAGIPADRATEINAVIDSLCLALNTAVSLSIDASGESAGSELHQARIESLFRLIAEMN